MHLKPACDWFPEIMREELARRGHGPAHTTHHHTRNESVTQVCAAITQANRVQADRRQGRVQDFGIVVKVIVQLRPRHYSPPVTALSNSPFARMLQTVSMSRGRQT